MNEWCRVCRSPFEPRPQGRPQRFCSPSCRSKAKNIRAKFGMVPSDVWRLWDLQGRVCAMPRCKTPILPFAGTTSCHVDHCHATGRIRGLLCHPCNVGLGHFEALTLRGAAEYLERG